jgi:hypothetical protein
MPTGAENCFTERAHSLNGDNKYDDVYDDCRLICGNFGGCNDFCFCVCVVIMFSVVVLVMVLVVVVGVCCFMQ